ncbi:response regulator transcription factor [Flavivirga rizhaonensis]|uniref:Response regulator transcription factor n=1 Tax=Flavivirga rizhaonensis TaxID=2559571 RepID=A0A4V3P4R8_9FLAO|nr:response regulator [Flavivirga rizhaonensis]TGV02434.1 response regulator transcription factor [Flavivirga rizhaonensis]
MFQKVLIAEDQNTIHKGLENILKELNIKEVDTVQYCDDALLKIKASLNTESPIELLITDLSFKEGHRDRTLTSGQELIQAVMDVQPELKIIVFSVEHRIGKIKNLIEVSKVDAYVEKGREESREMIKAVRAVLKDEIYYSHNLAQLIRSADDISQTDIYDELLLQLLAKGLKRNQIASYFKEKDLPARSLRSIEKRINKLKILFDANTSEQLVAIAIDRGLI